jgi:hypothetical protein
MRPTMQTFDLHGKTRVIIRVRSQVQNIYSRGIGLCLWMGEKQSKTKQNKAFIDDPLEIR